MLHSRSDLHDLTGQRHLHGRGEVRATRQTQLAVLVASEHDQTAVIGEAERVVASAGDRHDVFDAGNHRRERNDLDIIGRHAFKSALAHRVVAPAANLTVL